ncbi:uncharacterized protein GGS22DRAFT_123669 [Annulohypoxylon maeteangense]|uniref:uncharacterized protein n=1 Tax=Annulohypoxylon maeteangense TaxID=1927788 RepID=UPI002007A7E4|nr:uncharacterized protein GGS22DRAFT_123669 [Annulohypoxylon maeteangense]KAI0886071.1 hypothetical protein GGS22DRAFT_123669 [Annulohypoxylon maeteangense]
MAFHSTETVYPNASEPTRCNSHAYHADRSFVDGDLSCGTSLAIYGASGRPDASWRWKCCSCVKGGNQSYIYNNSCIECGHIRSDSCCETYIAK